jgi:integrase
MMNSQEQRRVRYQNGTLERKSRKNGPNIWTFRWVDRAAGTRRRVKLGTVKELRTMQAVKCAADGHRLSANRDTGHNLGVTMAGFLDRYERECVKPFVDVPIGGLDNRRPSVQCARGYQSIIRKWVRPKWGAYPLAAFNEPHIRSAVEEWLGSLPKSERNAAGLAPKSVRGIWSLMKLIFRKAVKWGYLAQNAMDLVDLPPGSTKRQAKPRSLSPLQYLELVKLYGPMERAALEVAGWLGTRRSEGFGLQWQDLDFVERKVSFERGFVNGRITPLKTEASRADLSLPEDVVSALLAWQAVALYTAPTDWVFASPVRKGRLPYWPGQLMKKHIKPVALKAGFGDIGWHTFRHSLSSWGKQVLKLEQTKELLRHEHLKTTSELYGCLPLEAKRVAQQQIEEFVKNSAAQAQVERERLVPPAIDAVQ